MIRNNKEWYNKIITKSLENNISIDKQMQLDAESVLSDELFKT